MEASTFTIIFCLFENAVILVWVYQTRFDVYQHSGAQLVVSMSVQAISGILFLFFLLDSLYYSLLRKFSFAFSFLTVILILTFFLMALTNGFLKSCLIF